MNNQHPLQRLCEQSFSANQYVHRERLEGSILQWLQDPMADRKPILSLVGPPGSGKSWLLAHTHQMLETEGIFVLFLGARQLMDLSQHDQIKGEIIHKANVACAGLDFPHDLLPPLSALVAEVTQRLCTHCAGQQFLILVDGCDDLATQEEFDSLQIEHLRPFFASRAHCIRMIMARRLQLTDYTLKQFSQSLMVGVFDNDTETEAHRNNLSIQLPSVGASWPELPSNCNYHWNHPYINCYLVNSSQGGSITTGTLASCCRAVIRRSIPGNPAGHQAPIDDDLRKLALMTQKYKGDWTDDDFRAKIGEDMDYAYMRRGLISARQADDEMSGPTYKVIDGLCELLAALPEEEFKS